MNASMLSENPVRQTTSRGETRKEGEEEGREREDEKEGRWKKGERGSSSLARQRGLEIGQTLRYSARLRTYEKQMKGGGSRERKTDG